MPKAIFFESKAEYASARMGQSGLLSHISFQYILATV